MTPTSSLSNSLNRRQFIASTALTSAGILLAPKSISAETAPAAPVTTPQARRRYALVGVGSRSDMYREAVLKTYADHCEMVGFCDIERRPAQAGATESPRVGAV